MAELRQRLKHALEITQTASEVAMTHFRRPLDIETKSDESPVTIADKATESAIREGLKHHYPQDAIFGEEFGKTGAAEDMWIIDPIDGTRSFITGLPLFGMLLGYVVQGGPTMGVIRMPALKEVYAGGYDMPSTCNGNTIKTSACTSLNAARLFINEGDKLAQQETAVFNRLIAAGNLRRMATDCYPHALVASGHADAVVDFDLQPYDYLPVSAVVEAAGGVMTDWQGNSLTMESDGRTLTAATPQLHTDLLEIVSG